MFTLLHGGNIIKRKENMIDEASKMANKLVIMHDAKLIAKMKPGDENESKISDLEKKAKKSGISYSILKKVYDRGMAAWKTGHRPGTTPQQWAFARVNSFITGGGARKSDIDLWKKI